MSENKNVPELRFPGFEGEWKSKSLQKVCLINPKSSSLPDEFVYIDLESVLKGRLIKKELVKKSCAPSRAQRVLQNNDILFQMVRPYQRNNLFFNFGNGYVGSTGYAQLRTDEEPNFVYQYLHLNKFVTKVNSLCTGTSYPAINSNDLGTIKISLPAKLEQQKIADFLSAVDKKIEQLTEKHRLLTEYKKGVMQQIFSQQIRFKDDEGNEYPEWQKVKFSNLFTFLKTNALSRADLVEDGEVKNIHYGDIHTRLPSQTRIEKIWLPFIAKHIDLSKLEDALCLDGDLVVADASEDYLDIGKAIELSGIAESNNKVVAGLHTFLARPDKSKIAKGYSGYVMQIDVVRKQIMRLATGVSVLGVSKTNIGKVVLPIPCIAEQEKIADLLIAIDNKIDQALSKIEQTKAFKKGLLQKMFV